MGGVGVARSGIVPAARPRTEMRMEKFNEVPRFCLTCGGGGKRLARHDGLDELIGCECRQPDPEEAEIAQATLEVEALPVREIGKTLVVGTVDRMVMEVPNEKIRSHANLSLPEPGEVKAYTAERLVHALYNCPGMWPHADRELRECLLGLAFRVAQRVNVYPFIAEMKAAMDRSEPAEPVSVPKLQWVPYDIEDRYWFEGDAIDVTEREADMLEAERAKFRDEDEADIVGVLS